jgi:hypothetical protein
VTERLALNMPVGSTSSETAHGKVRAVIGSMSIGVQVALA